MVPGDDHPVGSDAMEIDAGQNPALPRPGAGADAPESGHEPGGAAGPGPAAGPIADPAQPIADASEPIADAAERVSLSSRLRQTKTIVSILVPLTIIAFFVALNREFAGQGSRADRQRQPRAGAGRIPRVLPRLPAARPALGDAAAWHRLSHPAS